jgi:hypothetical protein
MIAALLLSIAGAQSTQAQTDQLKDYVPCQFTGEVEARWRQDSTAGSLYGAKYAVRTTLQSDKTIDKSEKSDMLAKIASIRSIDELTSQIRTTFKSPQSQQVLELAVQRGQEAEKVRPNDVSCSQSIFSFKEASDILGKRIANRYVVIQVVVRNLSEEFEFILHDVQAAVPEGKDPFEPSHFRAGRDKLLARGVAAKGQSQDPRNLLMGGLDALSATAQGAASFASADFNLGTGVLGVLIPPLKRWFPDYTVDQLNRLNDLGFSASSSYKIVVPKSGSVPFVTFVPQEAYNKNPAKWTRAEFLEQQSGTSVGIAGTHVKELDTSPKKGANAASGGAQ